MPYLQTYDINPITPEIIDNSAEDVFVNPTRKAFVKFTFTNITASPVTITVWNRPSGDAAADANKIIGAMTIPANTPYVHPVEVMVAANGNLSAQAGTGSAISVSGIVTELETVT